MSAERPPITEQHRSFPGEIVEISQKISRLALRRIHNWFEDPPTQNARNLLNFGAYFLLPFSYKGQGASSGSFSARIDNSDFIVFDSLSVPDWVAEAMPDTTDYASDFGEYPTRIIDMGLGYEPKGKDPYVKSFRLVTGPRMPLVLIDREIFSPSHITAMELERIGLEDQLQLPEGKFHYLEALELPPIRDNLIIAAIADLDIKRMLNNCQDHAQISGLDQEAEWFGAQAATLPPYAPEA